MDGFLAPYLLSVSPSPDLDRDSDSGKQAMRINHYFPCVLVCVLIAILVSSMPAEERQKRGLKQQLHERRVAYRDTLQKAFDVLQRRYIAGADDIGCVSKVRAALLEAELAIESESDMRLKKIEDYVDQLKQEEQFHIARFKNGSCRMDEVNLAIAHRIHGEIMLLEEQERQQRP